MPNLLVLNAGSSTLKFAIFEPGVVEARVTGLCDAKTRTCLDRDRMATPATKWTLPADASVSWILDQLVARRALPGTPGHNLVGGRPSRRAWRRRLSRQRAHRCQREEVALTELAVLAPLHNPPALAGIAAAEAALPDVPQVAVFDTAFFARLPPPAFVYPLPYEWYHDWGIRRFGFHGISHAYCATRAAEMLGRDLASLRIITCHLGNGCSASAVRGGDAVATSMGFTPACRPHDGHPIRLRRSQHPGACPPQQGRVAG